MDEAEVLVSVELLEKIARDVGDLGMPKMEAALKSIIANRAEVGRPHVGEMALRNARALVSILGTPDDPVVHASLAEIDDALAAMGATK